MSAETTGTDIYPRLANLLATRFGLPEEEITPEATFADLELDSLALVEIALAVQKDFGVAVGDDELEATDTITAAAAVISAKLAAAGTVPATQDASV